MYDINVASVINPCCLSIKVITVLDDLIWLSHQLSPRAIELHVNDEKQCRSIVKVLSAAHFVISTNIPIIVCNKSTSGEIKAYKSI